MIPAPSTGDPTGACRRAVFSFSSSTCARKVETVVLLGPESSTRSSIKSMNSFAPRNKLTWLVEKKGKYSR